MMEREVYCLTILEVNESFTARISQGKWFMLPIYYEPSQIAGNKPEMKIALAKDHCACSH